MGPAALLFDVFGTVVDWRASVVDALVATLGDNSPDPGGEGWGSVADRWRREGYLAPVAAMAAGESPREPIDAVLRRHLARILAECGVEAGEDALDGLTEVWDRLTPWPDAVAGLDRLRRVATIGTLSNGTFGGLVRMARHGCLPWDCVISAELFGSYKPDPAVYTGAASLLGLRPEEVVLVAAHPPDLRAARRAGLSTAFVGRPLEWGPDAAPVAPDDGAGWVATDFADLASQLGA